MSLTLQGPLLLAGAGRMGGAILARLLERGLDPRHVIVQDPEPASDVADLLADRGIDVLPFIDELSSPPGGHPPRRQAAGRRRGAAAARASSPGPRRWCCPSRRGGASRGWQAHLPAGTAVVRAMPNTPAAIGRGVTVAVANANVTPVQQALADDLLAAVGEVLWVEDEALLDPVTAVSGSGPAYVFLLVECLAEAGRAAGLDAALAERLARADGCRARPRCWSSQISPRATCAPNVTSPGGTTAAALEILGRRRRAAEADDGGGGRRNETRPRAGEVSEIARRRSRPRCLRT